MNTKKSNPKTMPRQDRFLTPSDVSHILKVSKTSVYAMLVQKKIPGALKIGGQWRVNPRVFWEEMKTGGV